jgi:hypothetical protein
MIQNSSVLVDLNLGVWTARKMDKRVSQEIDASKNTRARAGNYHKNLLAGTEALASVHSVASAIRSWHYSQTLPWADNGQRLLTMANFFEYKSMFSDYQRQFDDSLQAFYTEYPTLMSAMAFQLGNLFNPDDYPALDDIRRKNYLRVVFSPVPDSGDFRVDIPEQYRQELEQISRDREAAAMKDLWDRLHECLKHMSDKLAGEEKQIFRDTLVTNTTELCSMLTKLNVTNDPKLEHARQEVEKALMGVTAVDLRKHPGLRQNTKARVDQILSMF